MLEEIWKAYLEQMGWPFVDHNHPNSDGTFPDLWRPVYCHDHPTQTIHIKEPHGTRRLCYTAECRECHNWFQVAMYRASSSPYLRL